jgi:hypothetical protein
MRQFGWLKIIKMVLPIAVISAILGEEAFLASANMGAGAGSSMINLTSEQKALELRDRDRLKLSNDCAV